MEAYPMNPSRRSFLALVAAAVARPELALTRTAAAPIRPTAKPEEPSWLHFLIWDTLRIEPGQPVEWSGFEGRAPRTFLIHRLSVGWLNPDNQAADVFKVVEATQFRISVDGLNYASPLLHWLPLDIWPAITGREGLKIEAKAPALDLSAPVDAQVLVSGIVQGYEL
jgi:hypothetical protein